MKNNYCYSVKGECLVHLYKATTKLNLLLPKAVDITEGECLVHLRDTLKNARHRGRVPRAPLCNCY